MSNLKRSLETIEKMDVYIEKIIGENSDFDEIPDNNARTYELDMITELIPNSWHDKNLFVVAYSTIRFHMEKYRLINLTDVIIFIKPGRIPCQILENKIIDDKGRLELKIFWSPKATHSIFVTCLDNGEQTKERIYAAISLFAALNGRGIIYNKLYEHNVDLKNRSICATCQNEVTESIDTNKLEDISSFYKSINNLSKEDKGNIYKSLQWYESAIRDDNHTNAYINLWTALETLVTKERRPLEKENRKHEKNVVLITDKIANIKKGKDFSSIDKILEFLDKMKKENDLLKNERKKKKRNINYIAIITKISNIKKKSFDEIEYLYKIKKIYKLRNLIVHDGYLTIIDYNLLEFIKNLYIDILFSYLGAHSENRSDNQLKNFDLEKTLDESLCGPYKKNKNINLDSCKFDISVDISSLFNDQI